MPKRHIAISKNNRDVLYGVHKKLCFDRYWAVQDDGEIIDYRIELKNWLDTGETIASTTETTSGVTAIPTLNSTSVDYVIEGCGCLESTITTSAGLKKVVKIDIVDPSRGEGIGHYINRGYYAS